MITDQSLEKTIQENLYWDFRVNSSDIRISVSNGKVTLEGSVPTYSTKLIAKEDILVIEGVKAIEDKLTISLPTIPVIKCENLARSIEISIIFNPEISVSNLNVKISNNKITLEGLVPSCWQKWAIKDIVKKISGFLEIENKISIVKLEEIEDEIIKERISRSLEKKNLNKNDEIKIFVKEGILDIDGKIPEGKEYTEFLNSIRFCPGVLGLKNENILELNKIR